MKTPLFCLENTIEPWNVMIYRFKYVFDPFLDPRDECLVNANMAIPWQHVAAVVVSIDSEHTLTCPICLNYCNIPKIAKCGHTYW
jgi:hypothetical protein